MINIRLIIISLILSGCSDGRTQTKSAESLLEMIQFDRTLVLQETDDRFGEYGGNTFRIKIHRKSWSDELIADYSEYEGSKKPPPPPPPETKSVELYQQQLFESTKVDSVLNIELTQTQIDLAQNAIVELLEMKLTNSSFGAHGGIRNRAYLIDSTLLIEDYPSKDWEAFHKLKESIIK